MHTFASTAVGRPGPLPRQQRDALRQMQIAGDMDVGDSRMEKLFSTAERNGVEGPDGSLVVAGLRKVFSGLSKNPKTQGMRTGLFRVDV